MFTTGNTTVDAIGQMHLEGNVIPHTWYENIRLSTGKPDLIAITLLSEIVYWYRPIHLKEEASGRLLGIKKKFKADALQRSYDSFVEQFGFSKKQVREAMDRLEQLGLITRDFRTITSNGTNLSNVLFIDLNIGLLEGITFLGNRVLPKKERGYCPNGKEGVTDMGNRVLPKRETPIAPEGNTYTEITTEITNTEITKKNTSRKRVYDESSVEYQLANRLYKKILANDCNFKKPNLNSWADHIRLMMERDQRTAQQIEFLIDWSQNNSFWQSNILSTKKLREKATTLILQIKGEREKANGSILPQYQRGRREIVPQWFKERQLEKPQNGEIIESSILITDVGAEPSEEQKAYFEAERQKILATLGKVEEKFEQT